MSDSIKVKKRNGRGTEPLNLDKMHKMVEEACSGIAGVSASQVEINSGLQFYDGITTHFLYGTENVIARLLKFPANLNALPNTSN